MTAFSPTPLLWACLAVLIWSTTATIAVLLRPSANFLGIVLVQYGAGLLVLVGWVASRWLSIYGQFQNKVVGSSSNHLPGFLLRMLGGGVAMWGYHTLYFFAIQRGPSVPANLINYLWPLFLPLFGVYLFNLETSRWGQWEWGLLGTASLGVSLLTWEPGTELLSRWSWAHTAALGAAGLAGIYINLARWGRRWGPSVAFWYGGSILLSAPLMLATFWLLPISIHMSWTALPWLLFLGGAGMGGAQLAWIHALETGPTLWVSSLAYLIPVLSTVLLVMVVDAPLTTSVGLGGTLVVISNILLHDDLRAGLGQWLMKA